QPRADAAAGSRASRPHTAQPRAGADTGPRTARTRAAQARTAGPPINPTGGSPPAAPGPTPAAPVRTADAGAPPGASRPHATEPRACAGATAPPRPRRPEPRPAIPEVDRTGVGPAGTHPPRRRTASAGPHPRHGASSAQAGTGAAQARLAPAGHP